jgi:DNA-3-methyladenine glycosylase I
MKKHCPWLKLTNIDYVKYHDEEWGRPVHNDRLLFEMLILEGAQAGLSWETVLNKRTEYKKVFYNFDVRKCSKMSEEKLEKILLNPGIIRNRLKVYSVPINAKAFMQVQKEFGTFDTFLWSFVKNRPIKNNPKNLKDYHSKSELSDRISKELKNRGFKFIGTTIIYAYLQAVGVINDHSVDCFLHGKI